MRHRCNPLPFPTAKLFNATLPVNVALLFCGFFPGVIHAMFVVNTDMRLNVCTSYVSRAPILASQRVFAPSRVPTPHLHTAYYSELALTNAPGANMLERAEQAVVTPPATARPPVAVGGPLSKAGGLEGPPTSPPADPKAA